MQIAAATMPGNSGGPIVDFSGNVLGITSFALDWHDRTYEFCISASEIQRLVARLDGKMVPLWNAVDGDQEKAAAIDP